MLFKALWIKSTILNHEMAIRYRVMVYFPDDEILKGLEEWAKEENRSVSNLAATILGKALQEKSKKQVEENNAK
jgi:hypothetical protein